MSASEGPCTFYLWPLVLTSLKFTSNLSIHPKKPYYRIEKMLRLIQWAPSGRKRSSMRTAL